MPLHFAAKLKKFWQKLIFYCASNFGWQAGWKNKPRCRNGRGDKGFSIVEIVVVLGILTFFLAGGIFVSFGSLRGQNFLSEEKMLVDLLWLARNRSLNNFGSSSHGVFIDEDNFILFQGEGFSYAEKSEEFARDRSVEIKTDTGENQIEIIFQKLTGQVLDPKALTMSDGAREILISVGAEGRVN